MVMDIIKVNFLTDALFIVMIIPKVYTTIIVLIMVVLNIAIYSYDYC